MAETAADLDFEFGFELLLLVERADELVLVDDFVPGRVWMSPAVTTPSLFTDERKLARLVIVWP